MKRIAVIGAGITGVTSAYALLQRGYAVTVFERNRYPAMETSFANGGQLSASNAEVWTKPATLLKGMRWMFRKDAPLSINLKPDWHKYSWLAEFTAQCGNYEANTVKTVELALAARKPLLAWAQAEQIDFNIETRGILHFYNDAKSFQEAVAVNKLLRQGGLVRDEVCSSEIEALEPALRGRFHAGMFTPGDFTGDIHQYTRGLSDACERHGGEFVYEASVQACTAGGKGHFVDFTQPDEDMPQTRYFDAVVICAGTGSRDLAAKLGDRINIYPVKGYSLTVNLTDAQAQAAAPWVSLLDDDAKIVTSRLGKSRMRIAGTAELNGYNRDIRADRIEPLLGWCRRYLPDMPTDRVIPWAGLRPMTPSMLPHVGAGSSSGVFYNTGHGHLGWTLSAATAELLGDAVMEQLPPEQMVVTVPEWRQAS